MVLYGTLYILDQIKYEKTIKDDNFWQTKMFPKLHIFFIIVYY